MPAGVDHFAAAAVAVASASRPAVVPATVWRLFAAGILFAAHPPFAVVAREANLG